MENQKITADSITNRAFKDKKITLYNATFLEFLGGDIHAVLLLSRIIYWYMLNSRGQLKVKYKREGKLWIVKTVKQWREETGLSYRQYYKALKKLKNSGLIEVRTFRYGGTPKTCIWLDFDKLGEFYNTNGAEVIEIVREEPPSMALELEKERRNEIRRILGEKPPSLEKNYKDEVMKIVNELTEKWRAWKK